jgi:uncharacterized protein involved in outer membrane biogenesis
MRWKWFLGICAFLIIASITVAYVFLATYEYNKFKPHIAQMVKYATGRELNLAGELDLAIGFSTALVVTDIAFANAPWGSRAQMVTVEKLQVQIRFLPLLQRKVKVKNISLTGVEVLLETDPKGKGNWDLIAENSKGKSAGTFGATGIKIDDIHIENLRFIFHNGKTGSKRYYTLTRLDVARSENEDEVTLGLKADYNSQPITLSGKIGRIHNLFKHQPFPLDLSGTFSNATVKVAGAIDNLPNLAGIDLKLDASGQDLSEFGPIIGQKLPKTDQFALKGQLTGSAKALLLEEAQCNANRGNLQFTANGAVKDLLTLSGMDLNSSLKGNNLEAFGEIIGEKLPVTDAFAVEGRLTGSTQALSLKDVQANARQGSLGVTVTGEVQDLITFSGLNLQVTGAGKSLAEIGPLVGAELPELGRFDVSGKLSGSAKTITLDDFSAVVEKSDFNGMAKLEFLERPKLTVRLDSSVIDFTALMKSLERDIKKPAGKDKQLQKLFSDAPLPLDLLKKMDADIVLKARNIHSKDARLEFGHMTLKLQDHDFSIDTLEATYKETRISGNLQIKAGTPSRVATHFLVQGFNLGDFLKETGKNDQIRAIIDIAAHGKSRGDSVRSLMANLDGAIGVVMGEGYLTKHLDLLATGLTGEVFQVWKPPEAVDQIKCAVVQFDIQEGVAASQAFVFDTGAGVLTGDGEINLDTEKINFLLVPKPARPDFRILTNLRVSGSVLEPSVGVDKASALTRAARALSTLVVGPLGLLAPFIHLGANKSHPCDVPSIGQLGLNIPAEN